MGPKQSMSNEGENEIISNSTRHENVDISISQTGGNLPFEPVDGKSQKAKVKTEDFTDEDNLLTGCQISSTTPTMRDSTIQIKHEYDWEKTLLEARNNEAIWDSKRVKKRKRSKLPQYTLSPLARFINNLQHVSLYDRSSFHKDGPKSANWAEEAGHKYDDFLIYEKCTKFVPENEIGLGAKLLSPPPPLPPPPVCSMKSTMVVHVKEESC